MRLVLAEMAHRIANEQCVLAALISQAMKARDDTSRQQIIADVLIRLETFARLNRMLAHSEGNAAVSLHDTVEPAISALLQAAAAHLRVKIALSITSEAVPQHLAWLCAIAGTEFILNAIKHGEGNCRNIAVIGEVVDDCILLSVVTPNPPRWTKGAVRRNYVADVGNACSGGLGQGLIDKLVRSAGGETRVEIDKSFCVRATVVIPLAELRQCFCDAGAEDSF
ncbi:MAG: hypothetical protein M3Q51_02325 [Pseudomonadota bacterium]|nr:hypothetical protein [Pseudomonadota bacterium]